MHYPGQKVVETFKFDPKKVDPAKERAIINKQLTIYFTTGSDQIMAGSNFVLDSLGETMTAFGNTLLRIEGNTDNTGSRNFQSLAIAEAGRRGEGLSHRESQGRCEALPDRWQRS
jgi:outer membrane protein OmpA-like peptidoglycan-associated protein